MFLNILSHSGCAVYHKKRHKESRNLGSLSWFYFIFSVNKLIAVRVSARFAFYLFYPAAQVVAIFPLFFGSRISSACADMLASNHIFYFCMHLK